MIGTLTVAMATLHAFHDPARPWWAAGAILAVSLTAGLVAMLLRKPVHVYFSGLLINLAGTIVWWAYSPSGARWPEWNLADMAGLVQANVLCLAIGSVVWSLVELLPQGVPNLEADGQPPFAHLAAQMGAVGIGLVTAAGVATTLFGADAHPHRATRLDCAGGHRHGHGRLSPRSPRALPPADALWSRPVGRRPGTLGPATRAADVLLVGGRRIGRLRPGHGDDRLVLVHVASRRMKAR